KGYAEVEGTAPPEALTPGGAGKAPAVEEPAPAPVQPAVTRAVDVEPPDWVQVPGRPRQPQPRPQPKPFDLRACVDRVARLPPLTHGYAAWDKAKIAPVLEPEEARFWFRAMIQANRATLPEELAEALAVQDYRSPLPRAEVVAQLQRRLPAVHPEIKLPLVNL